MRQLSSHGLRRKAFVALVSLSLITVAIGSMHTRAGRLLLVKLGVPCPVNRVDPKLVAAARDAAIGRSRGSAAAPTRPALGLQLDASTMAEVSTWATRNHTRCDAITRGYHFLRCRGVSAAALGMVGPPVSEIWFSFGPTDTLMAINLYRRSMTEAQTEQSWQSAVQRLRQSLGTPTRSTGDITLASLINTPVAVARVQYTYADYIATVTASHMPYGGLAVREQYMSATMKPGKGSQPS
jgi:hypothetical protein